VEDKLAILPNVSFISDINLIGQPAFGFSKN
jgi:hypothetical protein